MEQWASLRVTGRDGSSDVRTLGLGNDTRFHYTNTTRRAAACMWFSIVRIWWSSEVNGMDHLVSVIPPNITVTKAKT